MTTRDSIPKKEESAAEALHRIYGDDPAGGGLVEITVFEGAELHRGIDGMFADYVAGFEVAKDTTQEKGMRFSGYIVTEKLLRKYFIPQNAVKNEGSVYLASGWKDDLPAFYSDGGRIMYFAEGTIHSFKILEPSRSRGELSEVDRWGDVRSPPRGTFTR